MWVVTAAACPSQSNGPRGQRNGTGRVISAAERAARIAIRTASLPSPTLCWERGWGVRGFASGYAHCAKVTRLTTSLRSSRRRFGTVLLRCA